MIAKESITIAVKKGMATLVDL